MKGKYVERKKSLGVLSGIWEEEEVEVEGQIMEKPVVDTT
jgi:hypothetical protein